MKVRLALYLGIVVSAFGNIAVRKRVAELADSSESEHVRNQAGLMLAIGDGFGDGGNVYRDEMALYRVEEAE